MGRWYSRRRTPSGRHNNGRQTEGRTNVRPTNGVGCPLLQRNASFIIRFVERE